jgi:hypothetical protein
MRVRPPGAGGRVEKDVCAVKQRRLRFASAQPLIDAPDPVDGGATGRTSRSANRNVSSPEKRSAARIPPAARDGPTNSRHRSDQLAAPVMVEAFGWHTSRPSRRPRFAAFFQNPDGLPPTARYARRPPGRSCDGAPYAASSGPLRSRRPTASVASQRLGRGMPIAAA